MANRKTKVILICFSLVILLGIVSVPYLKGRLSWYSYLGALDGAAILVTCESQTPMFRTYAMNLPNQTQEPLFAKAEVFLACLAKDRFVSRITSEKISLGGSNRALLDLVTQEPRCNRIQDFTPSQVKQCSKAHFSAIDWLLNNGVDINAGNYGHVIDSAVYTVNEDMFSYLYERGANPNLKPMGQKSDWVSSDSFLPRTTIEILENLIDENRSEFPEEVEAWQQMLELTR